MSTTTNIETIRRSPSRSDGTAVVAGPPGADGVSITSLAISEENGHLIVFYSDSSSQDVGLVQGPEGPAGRNVVSGAIDGEGHLILTMSDATTLDVGAVVPTSDPEVNALAGVGSAADKIFYFTGVGAGAITDFTAAGRTLVGAADAAAQRTALGLTPGAPIGASGFGQCALEYVSTTQIRLARRNGSYLFINGTYQQVPATPLTMANTDFALTATIYYVYAYMSGPTMMLEASTTAPADDATYGHKIKTGDATRSLVGMVYKTVATFTDGLGEKYIRSWYQDEGLILRDHLASPASTSSTTMGTRCSCQVLAWAGENVVIRASTTGSGNTAASGLRAAIYLGGSLQTQGQDYGATSSTEAQISLSHVYKPTVAELLDIDLRTAPIAATATTFEASDYTFINVNTSGSGGR
jgi:hypothetical protein